MSFRKVLIGIFMIGILCCGIGAGVMFQEYSSFEYMGEKNLGGSKTAEKTILENLYTDKKRKVTTSFTTYNVDNNVTKLKTSKKIPKDKVQIKVRYNTDNVEDIHIDKNIYSGDEYEDDEYEDASAYEDDGIATGSRSNVVEKDADSIKSSEFVSQEFFISSVNRLSGAEYFLTYKDEILKNLKDRKLYNYIYPSIISVEITVNPENKDMMEI